MLATDNRGLHLHPYEKLPPSHRRHGLRQQRRVDEDTRTLTLQIGILNTLFRQSLNLTLNRRERSPIEWTGKSFNYAAICSSSL